jgi:hypothetical protein
MAIFIIITRDAASDRTQIIRVRVGSMHALSHLKIIVSAVSVSTTILVLVAAIVVVESIPRVAGAAVLVDCPSRLLFGQNHQFQ